MKKSYCLTCGHVHIPEIPPTTFMCENCGFGSWEISIASDHEHNCPGHRTMAVEHIFRED